MNNLLSHDTFGLRPLCETWRTFPGARLSNGRGLEDVIALTNSALTNSAQIHSARMDVA
jgi:hypothetical protein